MRVESVEIFSDKTNRAVMRHPGRAYPGVLIRGDSLSNLCKQADLACERVGRGKPGFDELNDLRKDLADYLNHYKETLLEHSMQLPFSD